MIGLMTGMLAKENTSRYFGPIRNKKSNSRCTMAGSIDVLKKPRGSKEKFDFQVWLLTELDWVSTGCTLAKGFIRLQKAQ